MKKQVLDRVSRLLTALIGADEEARWKLERMGARVVEIRVRESELALYLAIDHGSLSLLDAVEHAPVDVTLSGRVGDFLALFGAQRSGNPVAAGRIDIRGDLATAQQLQALLGSIDVDWEDLLSRYTGDVVAYQLGRAARGGLRWVAAARGSLEASLSEFLRYEVQLLPTREDVDGFVAATARLDADVDRLAARVRRAASRR